MPLVRRSFAIWSVALLSAAVTMLAAPAVGSAATFGTAYDIFNVEDPVTGVVPFGGVGADTGARFPERLATADDLTGDGVRDIWASSYVTPVAGKPRAGAVYLINGANRSVIRTITEPDPQAHSQFGFYITNPGDLNGDGKGDLVVGALNRSVYTGAGAPCGDPEPNGCNEGQGAAYAFNGATGALLFSMANPNPQRDGAFGARLAGAGDINADGKPDILVGAQLNDVPTNCGNIAALPFPAGCRRDEGEAFIFNGANGNVLRQFNIPAADRNLSTADTCNVLPTAVFPASQPASRCGQLGGTVQSPGDIDSDGVADQLVVAYSLKPTPDRYGRLYLYSGKTGGLLATIDQPVGGGVGNSAFFGLQDVENNSPGDLTGDGVPDIYGDAFLQPGENAQSGAGRAWVFDGKATVTAGSGVVRYEVKDPQPAAGKGWGFTERKTDYNKDGFPDLFVSPLSGAATAVSILDGRDGSSLLKQLLQPTADIQTPVTGNPGPTFGQGLAAPGDLNGDGEPDYVVTAHGLDVNGTQDQGRLYFYLSNVPPAVTPPAGTPPAATPPPATPPAVPPAASRPGACANEKRGTSKGETINGTSAGDRLLGLGGNDVLNGLQGDDCLLGGDGKDKLSGADGNDRLQGDAANDILGGGSGNDRLSGGANDDKLSGGSGRDTLSGGAGRDKLSGGAGDDRLSGGAGNDTIAGGQGTNRFSGGAGNDTINSANGKRESVNCGSGRDVARADRVDRLRGCERVRRS